MRLTAKLAACVLLGVVGALALAALILPRSVITAQREGR